MGGIVKSNIPSDPTAREGMLRAYYSQHIELIDRCIAKMEPALQTYMENKTLLNETLESGMESLKTMKPGSEEYTAAVNSLAKLHEMQMNETAEENSKTAKEDELQLKWQQVKADVQKADSDRRVEILKTVGGIAGTLIMGGLFVWNQVNGWFNEEEGHIPLSPTFKDGSRTLMQNIFRK